MTQTKLWGRRTGQWIAFGTQGGGGGGGTGATIYGSNVGDGNPNSDPATRISQFGRIPCSRVYYGGQLPTALGTKEISNSPEKKCQVSFKGWQPDQVASGAADATLVSYAASLPSDWTIFLTYWHEPNSELKSGLYTAVDYIAAHCHIAQLLNGLPQNKRIIPMPNYSAPNAYGTNAWDDSWLMAFTDMGNPRAVLSWDLYGNPHGGGLASVLDPMPQTLDQLYAKTVLRGWNTDFHWGITEFNAPARTWDTGDVARAQWLTDYQNYVLSRPTKPHHIFVWEGNGAQFNQNFTTANCRNVIKNFTANSP